MKIFHLSDSHFHEIRRGCCCSQRTRVDAAAVGDVVPHPDVVDLMIVRVDSFPQVSTEGEGSLGRRILSLGTENVETIILDKRER